jgi:2-dehydro-3-deoxygluconokinase
MLRGAEAKFESPAVKAVCVGETIVMFAPPHHEPIEYSNQFSSYLAGAESNVAIGLERLGVHAGWIGKLPRNALGRKLVSEMRAHGVDTSAVIWTDNGRVGTFFFEFGASPRPSTTIWDRAHSAATTMTADELDWEYISRSEWLHMTGITPALSETCRATAREIVMRARERGIKVSFDTNYRELMWSRAEARAACAEILPCVDLLVATEADAAMLLEATYERKEALRRLMSRNPHSAAVMTLGKEGAIAYDGKQFYSSPGHATATVNRLGAGDAFVAGLLYGYLRNGLQAGLIYGTAMAALKMTIPQNTPIVNKDDVERLIAGRCPELLR